MTPLQSAYAAAGGCRWNGRRLEVKWRHGRQLESMTSHRKFESMCIYLNSPTKFHPNLILNDGACLRLFHEVTSWITNQVVYFVHLASLSCMFPGQNRLWTSYFLLRCSPNLEPYTYCHQSLTITWLIQTSPQNSLLCFAITFSLHSHKPLPLDLNFNNLVRYKNYATYILKVLRHISQESTKNLISSS